MANSSADISLLSKIANYTEIMAKDPHSTAFVPLSDAYRQMGLLEDALEVAEKGVKALPRFCPGYVVLGRTHFDREDIVGAAAAFEAAYALDNESLPAIKGLAKVLVRQKNLDRARGLLKDAAELAPDDSFIKRMLSSLPAGSAPNAPDEEEDEAKDNEPIATSTIAEIYLKQGLPQRALKVYLDLQKNHPDNEELRRKIAEIKLLMQPQANTEAVLAEALAPVAPPAVSAASEGNAHVGRRADLLNGWLAAIRRRKQHVLQ
ncbi:MAG: tetratricopeptide repeat protein [Desulfuromonadales bacterium]